MNLTVLLLALLGALALLQPAQPLQAVDVRIETRTDVYGVEQQSIVGRLRNTAADAAYDSLTIFAEVYNADDEVIGEGFGYRVNACGVAVLDDPLQPGEEADFALTLDLYPEFEGDAAVPQRFVVDAQGVSVDPEAAIDMADYPGITQITAEEVVSVDWRASDVLLYGVGCDENIFTRHEWWRYDLNRRRAVALPEHPDATFLTEQVIAASRVNLASEIDLTQDATLIERSFFTFIPDTTRAVWQNYKHDLYTAERDGSTGRREVHTYLHQYSLRGFLFTPERNFLAYYFGAYGEPVRWITANVNGQLISNVVTVTPQSNTVPGVQYDGRRAIISGTINGVTGYYFVEARGGQRELLFEIAPEELAGNHYPAPAYFRRDMNTRFIYIIRPVEGRATLQCYHYEGRTLTTLTELPLQLATDERAWSWLSPDGRWLAISANGRHSGLWLADLASYECIATPGEDA
jgi:hypothetical protein